MLHAKTSGRLIQGGAYQAWGVGVKFALDDIEDFSHLMKLDIDVELETDYFNKLEGFMNSQMIGILGGVLKNSNREQTIHVPGPIKIYSKSCLLGLLELPLATGFDVMDEILAQKNGYTVQVVRNAWFKLNRPIGASQGLIHGRRRNGLVCRWTGYYFPYFILHALRYIFRKPFFLGTIAMLIGYFFSPPSPYALELKILHARQQKVLLLRIVRNPYTVLHELYARR